MNDYRNYEAEDFVHDEFFIEWALHPKSLHQEFWQTWLIENPDRSEQVKRAASILRSLQIQPADKQLSDDDVTVMLERFLQDTTSQRHRLFSLSASWLAAAAILILTLISGILFFKPHSEHSINILAVAQPHFVKIYNKNQTPKVIQLADGSIVVLKSFSEITYPSIFSHTKREVFLKGEAFFEVKKNPAKAFLVHAGHMVTKVLGTSFTVSAYHGDNGFKVVVNTGKVQVYNKQKNAGHKHEISVVLTPDLQTVYQAGLSAFKTTTVKVPLILSPKLAQKEFSFTNAPLAAIIAKLQEAYGIPISYDKQKYTDVTVTASLSKLPLDEKVRAICKAIDAEYEFKNGAISIK